MSLVAVPALPRKFVKTVHKLYFKLMVFDIVTVGFQMGTNPRKWNLTIRLQRK